MTPPSRGGRPPILPVRIVGTRPRLFIAGIVGVATIAALTAFTNGRAATRLLLGWDAGVGLYLALTIHTIFALHPVGRVTRGAPDGAPMSAAGRA